MLGSGASAAAALGPFFRGISSTVSAASAVPAVSSSSSGGLFASLGFGGKSRIETSLAEPLPSLPSSGRSSVPSVAPKFATGALTSGTKVVAIDSVSPVSSVALCFEAGTAYESDATFGASKLLEVMAFKSTANRTTFRLTRELEKIGASVTAKAGRDHVTYAVSAVKLHTAEAVETLLDAVLNPKLNYWETKEALSTVQEQLRDAQKQPALILADVLHRAAYEGSLGQALYTDPSLVGGISSDELKDYLCSTFSTGKAVLAAAGVGLEEFTSLANPLVDASSSTPSAKYSSGYVGGSLNVIAATSPLVYGALAFESKGGLSDPKAAAAAAVVKVLLDESRAVLPHTYRESDVFKSCTGLNYQYKDSGLVGVLASTAPSQLPQLVDAVCKKMEAVAKGVPEVQLVQAKQLAIAAYKAQVATSTGLVGAMGSQLLLTGSFSPAAFVQSVEALTAADVTGFVSKGLKASPTYVTYGSLSGKVPRYESITKRFA